MKQCKGVWNRPQYRYQDKEKHRCTLYSSMSQFLTQQGSFSLQFLNCHTFQLYFIFVFFHFRLGRGGGRLLLRVLRIDAHQQNLKLVLFRKAETFLRLLWRHDKRFQYFEVTNIETKSKIKVIRQMKFYDKNLFTSSRADNVLRLRQTLKRWWSEVIFPTCCAEVPTDCIFRVLWEALDGALFVEYSPLMWSSSSPSHSF